ncbi:MAG: hypothetical protein JO020_22325 [Chloroflexi bacterium]|nr:hypothetical protein [Chloroflexota bacterium]MBV9135290.1 hypothetical protein [Chloroflexota bacterium]MBV9896909.1 hypothetical protein [Chloroflexota bacterium]
MTTLIECAPPDTSMTVARKLAYRRLAAAILGLDVKSLSADLQLDRTRRLGIHPEPRYRQPEAVLR